MERTKILIVDDKPENILALKNLIEAPDVETVSALSGVEALDLLLDHDFALALVDVQMPVMSGFELAQLMRGTERSKHIPIIFVTAAKEEYATVFKGYEKGAVDFLIKPLDPHIVRNKVRVFVDLSQSQRRLKEQLRESERLKTAAEVANITKSRFLANISHEVRTPLGVILGYTELLENPDQSESDRTEFLQAIRRNGLHLLHIVNDILDISKLEAGRMTTERIDFSLPDFISDLRAAHEPLIHKKGLDFKILYASPLPRRISSDPARLRQILDNLLSNATKFTDDGAVRLRIGLQEGPEESPQLFFEVSDTGIGIERKVIEMLFRPFAQGDDSNTRKFGGTGLGLSISRQLAIQLGGNVEFMNSAPGQGACFSATVDPGPIAKANLYDPLKADATELSKTEHLPRPLEPLRHMRVLVVDDAIDNLRLLGALLLRVDAVADCARDGLEAMELVSQNHYDVILMDIQMPRMNGYEATKRLRSELRYGGPIIALTAHAMKEEREKCLAHGFSDFLSKPVAFSDLTATIARNAAHPVKREAPTSSNRPALNH